jgi:hypothetical protein
MKLYTEEEVINALKLAHSQITSLQNVIDRLKPIELPSDEEIEEKPQYWGKSYKIGFVDGKKWMRDKIKGGSYEQRNKTNGSRVVCSKIIRFRNGI